MNKISFASDNYSGAHPLILKALHDINVGHVPAYGSDHYTQQAISQFKALFNNNCDVYFVFNGTAANVIGLQACTESYNAIICASTAHINVDECGAPEKFTGCKLLTIDTADGKLTVDLIKQRMIRLDDQHHVQPRVISITQPTEYGTVYTPDEIAKIAQYAHANKLLLHMDGARFANAVAFLQCKATDITTAVGVDVLSFGGTKNGMLYGETVIFFNTELSSHIKYIRKQSMQLASKMRFIATQFSALLTDNLWIENAKHANNMTQLLAQGICSIPHIQITQKVQANSIFALIPPQHISPLQDQYSFYEWNESTHEVRWMTSFDTQINDVHAFVDAIKKTVR